MPCGVKEAGGVYRPRHPQESPFYRLVKRFYLEFEAVYEERYQERYGYWRATRPVARQGEGGSSGRSCASSSSATISNTASPASAALGAARNFSCLLLAAAGVFAPPAKRNGRWRRRAGSPSVSALRCRTGSSYSQFPSGCASISGSTAGSWASCAEPRRAQ